MGSLRRWGVAGASGAAALAVGAIAGALFADMDAHAGEAYRIPRVRRVVVDFPEQYAPDSTFEIRFRGRVRPNALRAGAIRVRTPAGVDALGTALPGRPLVDDDAQRHVVIRPEAIREYFQYRKRRSLAAAARATERFIAKLERTGNLKPIARVDEELAFIFGRQFDARVRVDDPTTTCLWEPRTDRQWDWAFRSHIAGEDVDSEAHQLHHDPDAYARLLASEIGERYRRPIDPITGNPATESVLRQREYRRVLFRRRPNVVTFVPDLPTDPDLNTIALSPGQQYEVRVGRSEKVRALLRVLPASTEQIFRGHDVIETDVTARTPRVLNVAPPHGEYLVDPTTDWEDPDDLLNVPEGERRPFRIRLRFSRPLDPRTVTVGPIRLTDELSWDEGCIIGLDHGNGTSCPIPDPPSLPIDVRLTQSRLGKVEVEIAPRFPLAANRAYRVHVGTEVRSLTGVPFAEPFFATFETSLPPRDADGARVVTEAFDGQHTSAETFAPWAAPFDEDPEREGLLVGRTDGPDGRSSSLLTSWLDMREIPDTVELLLDDPATPEVEGTRILERPRGGSMAIFVQMAKPFWQAGFEPVNSIGPWMEWRGAPLPGTERLVRFRVDFTLPEDYAPGTPRTALERIVLRANFR